MNEVMTYLWLLGKIIFLKVVWVYLFGFVIQWAVDKWFRPKTVGQVE